MKQKQNRLSVDAILVGITMVSSLALISLSAVAVTLSHPLSQLAQATPQQNDSTQPSVPAGKQDGPAESEPGGTRPTTPPPEPARPDDNAQKAGAKPALPPAPAEKTGPPITEKPMK